MNEGQKFNTTGGKWTRWGLYGQIRGLDPRRRPRGPLAPFADRAGALAADALECVQGAWGRESAREAWRAGWGADARPAACRRGYACDPAEVARMATALRGLDRGRSIGAMRKDQAAAEAGE